MNDNINNINPENDFIVSDKKTWTDYTREHRPKAPANINKLVWENIQRKNKKSRLTTIVSLTAACLVLAISMISLLPKQQEQSQEEKLALLLEARSMIEQAQATSEKNILYEDNSICIYTTIDR